MFMGVDSKLFDWICWLRCVTFIFRRFVGCSMHLVSPVTCSKAGKIAMLGYLKCPSQQQVGRGMFMKVGKKRLGWLAALALWPVVGWGQEIIEHPQNVTVCVGESALFTSKARGGVSSWLLNGTITEALPKDIFDILTIGAVDLDDDGNTILKMTMPSSLAGIKVQSRVTNLNNDLTKKSATAYLFCKPNQQFRVTDLTPIISNTIAQFYWNAHNSNFNLTTQYLLGVYDHNNHLIANYTTNTTQISYDLPGSVCHHLVFRITADQCPAPASSGFVQSEATTFIYREPDIDVTTQIDSNDNKTVLINVLDGNGTYWVSITDLDRGNQTTYNGTSPFSYTPALCGQYNLNVTVSPAQCADEPDFTHSDSISFTIPCPTTATDATETEIPDQPSGTQAISPSLLAVAAIIPLLKITRQAF